MNRIHNRFLEIANAISPSLEQAILAIGPVRLRKKTHLSLTETLCRAVAGQQLSTKAAATIWGRVIQSANGLTLTEHVASARSEELRNCGLSGSKTKAMKAIVDADVRGILDVDKLSGMDHVERSAQLTSIWGVGQWTADMLSIFYFADADVWPNGDLTACKTLERLTSKRRKTIRTAALFAPHRTYLAVYMYRTANAK